MSVEPSAREIRMAALFEQLEEFTRAVIVRSGGSDDMVPLLDAASLAFGDRRWDEARAKLAELHYLARRGREATDG